MKTTKKIVAIIALIVGIIFLANSASDIQLGSGLLMIFVALLGWPTK